MLINDIGHYGRLIKDTYSIFVAVPTMMSAMGTITLLFFSIFTAFLVMKNYVVHEMTVQKNVMNQHVFEMTLMDNIKMVMGKSIWRWPIPEKNIERDWNGIDYHINPEL